MASSVKFTGNLYTNYHTFQIAGQKLEQQAKNAVIEIAEMYADSLYETQKSLSSPDTLWYRKKKEKLGFDTSKGPWYATGDLMGRIQVDVTQDGTKRFRARAGFAEGSHYSGYKVSELVDILDANMPLIGPAWERIKPQANAKAKGIGVGIFN